MTELDLEAIAVSVNRAHQELAALCKGQRWRMSIPAQPDRDSDLIISAGLKSVDGLLAYARELEDKIERRRMRLVNAEADLLDIRGVLSPSGEDRKVPSELGDRVAPAIEWLVARVAELGSEVDQWKATYGETALKDAQKILAERAELQARVDVLTDTVNGRDEQIGRLNRLCHEHLDKIQRVRALHTEFRVYTECGHQHTEGEPGVTEANDVGLVCADGYLYSICRECCTDDDQRLDQTEECADAHDHSESGGGWRCPTLIALDGEPAEREATK